MIKTAGSWELQRLEYEPRQQLPTKRGSLDRRLLPGVQTSPPTHTPPGNHSRPGPLITSNPPPHPSIQASKHLSIQARCSCARLHRGSDIPHHRSREEVGRQEVPKGRFSRLCGPVHREQPKSGQNVMQSLPSFFPHLKLARLK